MGFKLRALTAQDPSKPNPLVGIIIVIALQTFAEGTCYLLSLPLPGSVLALLILLVGLKAKKNLRPPVIAASRILLKYLPLFLIPICAGIVQTVPASPLVQLKIYLVLFLAVFIGVVLTATLTQYVFSKIAKPCIEQP